MDAYNSGVWKRKISPEASPRCSFCRKSKEAVGKLIPSPSDYPKAYICNECIEVCVAILEDDKHSDNPLSSDIDALLRDPRLPELLSAVADWITRERSAEDASEELNRMREIASSMMPSEP